MRPADRRTLQVRTTKMFACGCGTMIDAYLPSVATQAVIGLAQEEDAAAADRRF
jgi:hypothetical protein